MAMSELALMNRIRELEDECSAQFFETDQCYQRINALKESYKALLKQHHLLNHDYWQAMKIIRRFESREFDYTDEATP